jgi:hypothetical protein
MTTTAVPMGRPRFAPLKLDDELKARLEDTHEDILILKGSERSPWIYVVRRPNRKEVLAYKHHAKRQDGTANEQFIRHITVFPTGDDLERQLERWPLAPDAISDASAFKDFVGFSVNEDLKG